MIKVNTKKIFVYFINILLFLFSISIFNKAGYIYCIIAILMIGLNYNKINVSYSELLLFSFSVFYYAFYRLYNPISIENIILYLLGPWTAFIIGKLYIGLNRNKNAFLCNAIILSSGMFCHGLLNLIAYMRSSYYENYQYYRQAVDFWRDELVNVNATGMFFTFAAGLSIGVLFANLNKKYKVIATAVIIISMLVSAFFANRALIVIICIILIGNLIVWLFSSKVSKYSKLKMIIIGSILLILFFVCLIQNVGNINEKIIELKIVERFTSENEGSRFDVWIYFLRNFNFVRYPFGGGKIVAESTHSYLHNMWLDVYNVAGIIPFVFLVSFTLRMLDKGSNFRKIASIKKVKNEYLIFQNLIFAIVLNCAVEPIIESNPYFFLMSLMILGSMEARLNNIQREL